MTISKRQNPQVPNQQTALHAIEEALTLLHFVQTLEGPEKDSVEHLLEATVGSLRERCPPKPRRGIENQTDAEVVPCKSQSCVLTVSPSVTVDLINAPSAVTTHSSVLPGC